MTDNMCIQDVLRLRYSLPRIEWLIGTISLVSLLYLSSQEIWKIVDAEPFPEVTLSGIILYVAFFLTGLILVHYYDTRKVVEERSVALAASLISITIDLFLISLSELIVLSTLQVLPQHILQATVMLIIGAMPSAMGSIVLSSLTADILRNRARKLYKEAKDLAEQMKKFETQIALSEKRHEAFRKRVEGYRKKQNDSNEEC